MPAWFIITAYVHEREPFTQVYSPAAASLVSAMGGRYMVRGRGGQLLEGPGAEGASAEGASAEGVGAIVIEWPDRETALRFWNSAEYAEIKKLREGLADVTVLLVEG